MDTLTSSITSDLSTRTAAVFPDARLTAADTRPFPVVMSHAAGDKIYDVEGNEYLDFHLSSGALVVGHNFPEVAEAVTEQVKRGANFGAMNCAAIELAEGIVRAMPSVEMLKFNVSGTEANLHAIRMARAYTGRDLIVRFEGAYHGHLDMVSLSNKISQLTIHDQALIPELHPIPDCAGIPEAIQSLCLVAPFNDLGRLQQILRTHGDRIAAVMMEPIQRFIEPTKEFLKGVRAATKATGSLLIFDEVVTGFRLGLGGAQELYGVRPDLTVLGKIIGAGYPNGAVGGSRELMMGLFGANAKAPVYLAGTFAGHAVAAAGGAATLRVLARSGSYKRLFELGETARAGLRQVIEKTGIPATVYGVGPMFHVAFTARRISDARSALAEDKLVRKAVLDNLLRERVHITGGRGFVSLQHSEQTLDELFKRFERAIGKSMRQSS